MRTALFSLAVILLCGTALMEPSFQSEAVARRVSERRLQETVRALVDLGPRMGGTDSGHAAAAWRAEAFRAAGLAVDVLEDEEKWCHQETGWKVVARAEGQPELVLERAWPYGFSPSASGRAPLSTSAEDGVALLTETFRTRRRPATGPRVVLVDGRCNADGSYPVVLHLPEGKENPQPVFGISEPSGKKLREWLAAGLDVEVEYELEAVIRRASPRTVVATLPAREGAAPGFFLVCAHGDSDAGGPGANDNASGEAIVLEMARAWAAAIEAKELPAPAREVRFAIWGSEIHSTRDYLKRRVEERELLGVVNYDQAGYGSGADQLNIEPDDIPGNRAFIEVALGVLRDHRGKEGFPERWATNKSLGGTDSYVFSTKKSYRALGRPSVTLFISAWDKPERHPVTPGMPGESWSDSDEVYVDYDLYYHTAGDLPENTTAREPWNMAWCVRVGLLSVARYLDRLE